MSSEELKEVRTERPTASAEPTSRIVYEQAGSFFSAPVVLKEPVVLEEPVVVEEPVLLKDADAHLEHTTSKESIVAGGSHNNYKPRPKFDPKQFLNGIYFALSTAAIFEVAHTWESPHLLPLVFCFGFFACAAYVLAARKHAHPSDFAISFSPRVNKSLRLTALFLPLPFLLMVGGEMSANYLVTAGDEAFDAQQWDKSMSDFKLATALNPKAERAYLGISSNYRVDGDNAKAIEFADKAIALDPKDSFAYSNKARSQLALDPKSNDAIKNAQHAIALDDSNGEAFGALAQLEFNIDNLDEALAAAQKHVELHYAEAHALELRADIFEKLGAVDEAAADRTKMATMQ